MKKDRDHFVSETYLKRFCDVNGCIHVFSKKDNKPFSTAPKEVCVKRGGDNIDGLPDTLILRNILQTLEPNLNFWLNNLIEQKINEQEKFKLSHYFAILDFLNPKSISSHKEMLEILKSDFPNLTFLDRDDNELRKEYLNNSNTLTHVLYASKWELLVNKTDFKFITCDYGLAKGWIIWDCGLVAVAPMLVIWRKCSMRLPRYARNDGGGVFSKWRECWGSEGIKKAPPWR